MEIKKTAVIVAGGTGVRMNAHTPKQFLNLHGKPILYYPIKAFLEAFHDIEIILVLPQEYLAEGKEVINQYFPLSTIVPVIGGNTRFHSVQQGLSHINKESIVFVHDAARCLVQPDLIRRCYEGALNFGSAIPVVACQDSVRILRGEDSEALDRNTIKLVQTPQTFYSKLLLPAYQTDYKEQFTDEASVVELFGIKVHLVEGEVDNIKITIPSDLVIAEQLLQTRAHE